MTLYYFGTVLRHYHGLQHSSIALRIPDMVLAWKIECSARSGNEAEDSVQRPEASYISGLAQIEVESRQGDVCRLLRGLISSD